MAIVKMVYNSLTSYSDKMYLNLYENHLSYITNFKSDGKNFQCEKCKKLFRREWSLKRHYSNCFHRTNYIFPRVNKMFWNLRRSVNPCLKLCVKPI